MDDYISVPITAEADDDGFIRRQCPDCGAQFKWFVSAEDDAETALVDEYHCPLCGALNDVENWNTDAQVEHALAAGSEHINAAVQSAVDDLFKGLKGVTYKPARDFDLGIDGPAHVAEPNDMHVAVPPCHPNEPVKVPDLNAVLHCLICGTEYRV